MLDQLYEPFKHWSENGSVFLISDTHFGDADCKLMDPNWIPIEEHIVIINKVVHKNDTIIHLGDVGDLDVWDSIWKKEKRPHEVLITGNHDAGIEELRKHFDEVYAGPLFIGEKILLSHEPINGLGWCVNIHGHDHNPKSHGDATHVNLASNVIGYKVVNLKDLIKGGTFAHACGIHRITIDGATKRKRKRERKR